MSQPRYGMAAAMTLGALCPLCHLSAAWHPALAHAALRLGLGCTSTRDRRSPPSLSVARFCIGPLGCDLVSLWVHRRCSNAGLADIWISNVTRAEPPRHSTTTDTLAVISHPPVAPVLMVAPACMAIAEVAVGTCQSLVLDTRTQHPAISPPTTRLLRNPSWQQPSHCQARLALTGCSARGTVARSLRAAQLSADAPPPPSWSPPCLLMTGHPG